MGLFSHHKKLAATSDPSPKGGKPDPPNLDRARNFASTIGSPRSFMQEIPPAQQDLATMRSLVRSPPAHAGMMALTGTLGGTYSKQEMALLEWFPRMKDDLESGYGRAKQCLDTDGGRSNPGMDDAIRQTADDWMKLKNFWIAYTKSQPKNWAEISVGQIGQLAAQALGIIA